MRQVNRQEGRQSVVRETGRQTGTWQTDIVRQVNIQEGRQRVYYIMRQGDKQELGRHIDVVRQENK